MANVNGFDPGVYAVDGARIRAATLRAELYSATGGAEGVVSPGDLKVRPLATPGAGVTIDRGTALVRNRSGNVRGETYAARAPLASSLDGPTLQPAPRSHGVILRIEDPEFIPWTLPAGTDPATYNYAKPILIQNIASGITSAAQLNLGYSALLLARIDIPANTTTITENMIKDMRKVAQPRRQRHVSSWRPADGVQEKLQATSPNLGLFPSMQKLVPCPEWATQVKMIVNVGNLVHAGERVIGGMRAEYGWNLPGNPYVYTETSGIHYVVPPSDAWSVERNTVIIAGEAAIPASFRGLSHYVRIGSNLTSVLTGGQLNADEWTTITVDLEFVEVPE